MDIEGTISNQIIYILIDPRGTLSYINPKVMEEFHLSNIRYAKPWSVQLATGARKKVTEFLVDCEVKIMDHVARINLNVFPLGSYDMIIGMEWLAKYKVILKCLDKTFTYVAEDQII